MLIKNPDVFSCLWICLLFTLGAILSSERERGRSNVCSTGIRNGIPGLVNDMVFICYPTLTLSCLRASSATSHCQNHLSYLHVRLHLLHGIAHGKCRQMSRLRLLTKFYVWLVNCYTQIHIHLYCKPE